MDTPDFLIRNLKDNKSYLIEIKPTRFDDYEQLNIRKKVVEHFIKNGQLSRDQYRLFVRKGLVTGSST